MPILDISALPGTGQESLRERCLWISKHFSELAAIKESNVSVIWRTLTPGGYVVAGQVARQHCVSAPLVISLVGPDFHKVGRRQKWLYAAASTLAECTLLPRAAIFCYYHPLASGEVYDGGHIVTW